MRCGTIGHWAGDPECKFPGSKSGAPGRPAPKPAAHFADMSDSSDDDGVTLTASPDRDRDAVAMMAVRQAKPSSRPSRAAASSSNVGLISRDLDVAMRPEDHGCIFPVGQFKGLSFWNVLFEQTGYYHHAKKHTPKSPYYVTWLNWVDKYFVVGADGIHLREIPVEHVEHRDLLVTRETGRRKPPNPPLPNKCQECREFTKQGSTGYTIRKTCLVCGHSETTRRDMVPLMTPENCPHDDTDFRGSSKSTHRTFCKKCCTFIDEAPMQIRKERVAIAKKVETASVRTVPIVESLVEESDGLNPVQLEELLPLFATLVTETCQSEVMTRARLHELLHQAINDVTEEEDSFSLVNEDGHGDPSGRELAGYVGICLHGSDIQYPQDLVYMNFETVDIARSSHVFAVLDEGCNSTCHSKAWAVDAEARLARLGYSMPLKDDSCKSFAGLGSGNTKTEGVRSIPFSLLLPDGNMNGELDSYQLSTGNSPLLLSLHAQTKLGLVKDLAKGVVSIQDQPLNIKRCSKSGLLVMNLTEGLTDIINTPPNELPKIPKCHRKYNLAYTASTSDCAMADHDQTGFHSRDYDVLQSKLNEEQLSNRQVIIVTRGRRFQRHAMRSNRATLSINCEDIYDPDQDVSLRAHVGWHHRILETLSKVDKFNEHLNSILEFVTQHQQERILVDLECKSGRHRSVGQGFAAFRCLKALGYNVVLIHSSSWMWGEMRCGGVCSDCRNVGASVGQIKHLIPKTQPTTIRPRGSVAASRAGVGDAPADSASVDHPTTTQIEEIRRLVQGLASDVGGLASDVGHLRSEQRKIAERRSRSPLRRRRLPTPPSPPRRRRSPSFSRKLPPWRQPQTSRGRSLGRDRSPSSRPAPSRPISSRPAPRSPDHPPPHISDVPGTDEGSRSTLPRRSREPPNDRDELERLVRNNLALDGPFDNKNISVTSLDGELLSEVVSFCVREGNRDRLFWICRPGVEDHHIRPNRIIKVANSIKHWKRSTWCRPRNGGGWELIEDNVDGNTMVRLENSWIDVVVFHHPPGVFDDSGRGAYMSVHVKLTPNKKLRDVRDDFEKSLNPKVEMKSSEPKRMYAVKSKPQPKVLTPKLEQDDSDSYEYDYEYSPTGFMAVRFDSNVDLTVHPDERRTMSKKHRKMVLEGINNLNNHDRVMQSSLGMQPQVSNGTSGVAVITSHPTLFQDLFEHTYDVGVNAAYLDGDAEPRGWSDMFEGCTLIIVAIEYKSEHYPLCHGDLVFELEQYCDATGCRFLIVDVAHTERWESFKTPQIPYINEVGLAFVSNDDELIQGFQNWSMYRQWDDVLNWEFYQWIRDWSLERELEDQMSVAFPAEIIEEAQEHGGNWDAVDGPEDVALQDPVEDLTQEETLLDEVDIPGLPEDESERRRSWRKLPQRVRIAVRRLHRALGHVPKSVMVNLVRAAKVSKEFVDAVKLHRCEHVRKHQQRNPLTKSRFQVIIHSTILWGLMYWS